MLQWLRDQVSSIWGTFWSYVDYYTQQFNSIWNGIIAWANDAKQKAIAWAYNKANEIAAWVWHIRQWLLDQAISLYNSAKLYAYNLVQQAIAGLQQLGANVWNMIAPFIIPIRDWLNSKIDSVKGWVDARKAQIEAVVNWVWTKVPAIEATIQKIIGFDFLQLVRDINNLKNHVIPEIMKIVSDPLSYVLACVAPFFITLLTGTLALAMGTVKYDMPTLPEIIAKQRSQK